MGDQAIYYIINDDSIHTDSGGNKLGIELHGLWLMLSTNLLIQH